MTQVSLFSTPNSRSERLHFQEANDMQFHEGKEKSYEISEINQKSIGSDSFTSGNSSRTSRRSELKSLKGERFIAKLTRSATNSPRIEYNSNSFLENAKAKLQLMGNIPVQTYNEKEFERKFRSPSQDVEDLENEWKTFKTRHNFESRGSASPYRSHIGLDSPGLSKASQFDLARKNRHEDNLPSRKTIYEKNSQMPNLLSKVIPQAKINLVQHSQAKSHNKFGVNHSKSLEPKKDSHRENYQQERLKKNDPLTMIYNKYSNINKKKECINSNERSDAINIAINHLTGQSFEKSNNERKSFNENFGEKGSRAYSSSSSFHSDSKPIGMISLVSSDLRSSIKDASTKESERYSGRNYDMRCFSKENFYDKSESDRERSSLNPGVSNPLEIRKTEVNREDGQMNKSDMNSKLLYYEPIYKEEQESLFNVPATTEKPLRNPKSISPKKMSLNLIRSIKVQSSNKQDVLTEAVSAFGVADEKEQNQIKNGLTRYSEKPPDETRKTFEEKEHLNDMEEVEPQTLKRQAQDLSIQKPFHFITKESNFSPSKKSTPDNISNLKFRKENPFRPDQKFSPGNQKQSHSVSLKQMPREKPQEQAYPGLKEKGLNTNSSQQINSSRPKFESISLKTEFVTLESARLQKHKLMTLSSASQVSNDPKPRDKNMFYLLATQEDHVKESSADMTRGKLKKAQTLESSKSLYQRKVDENSIKYKNSIENEVYSNQRPTDKFPKNKPKVLKIKK